MADATKTIIWPHQELLTDNKVNTAELPQKVQDKIGKFSSLTDKDAQESMDESIYGAVDDFLEAKAKEAKTATNKAKVAEHKKKKETIDVSLADTAKSPEQLAKEAEDKKKTEEKPKSIMNKIYPGRK